MANFGQLGLWFECPDSPCSHPSVVKDPAFLSGLGGKTEKFSCPDQAEHAHGGDYGGEDAEKFVDMAIGTAMSDDATFGDRGGELPKSNTVGVVEIVVLDGR